MLFLSGGNFDDCILQHASGKIAVQGWSVKLFIGSKVQCLFCFEFALQGGEGEKMVQILK